MHRLLIMGAGKIGTLIAFLLSYSKDYVVYLADAQKNNLATDRLNNVPNLHYLQLEATDEQALADNIKANKIEAIVSSLPYYLNVPIAQLAARLNLYYFDLTEDVETTLAVKNIAKASSTAFVSQCGLAPGFIGIVAHHLMQHFTQLDSVKMRVGALPTNVSNALQYSLTWSTEGLINEYGNACQAIVDGELTTLLPLEGLEEIKINGLTYEAFNTSGGTGSLVESYHGKVKSLDYKTIRYPGHCEKIKFLMNDLRLNSDRKSLKHILEHALPKTYQDVVLVYVSVTGIQNNQYIEENYVKKFYPKIINDHTWSAIQLTTASEICTIVDLIFQQPEKYKGFIAHEQFSYNDIINNRFGNYYNE